MGGWICSFINLCIAQAIRASFVYSFMDGWMDGMMICSTCLFVDGLICVCICLCVELEAHRAQTIRASRPLSDLFDLIG